MKSSPPASFSPHHLPRTSSDRLQKATKPVSTEADVDLDKKLISAPETTEQSWETTVLHEQKTVLYLAYGSNLASETFRGRRGVNPLSQINVYVPDLRLTFDLAGIPYIEPCFAGTQYRSENETAQGENTYSDEKEADDGSLLLETSDDIEKTPLIATTTRESYGPTDYHKDRWHKPLIGVVYEVTLKDYAHIIATEGGGNGYKDVVVTCYPFPDDYDPSMPTPDLPNTTPFVVHTLLSPWKPDSNSHGGGEDHRMRPDPSYAQPSARYLKLLMDGAAELNFPKDYRAYLADIRPYQITTWRQSVGRVLFLSIWGPVTLFILILSRLLANEKGIMPDWLASAQKKAFKTMWKNYDVFFRRVFGDGERTIGDV